MSGTWDVTWTDEPRNVFGTMDALLEEGWEPFAVTPACLPNGSVQQGVPERMWFRKPYASDDATADKVPLRSRQARSGSKNDGITQAIGSDYTVGEPPTLGRPEGGRV